MGVDLSHEGRLLEEQFLEKEGVSYRMADIQQGLGIGCSLRFNSMSEYPVAVLPLLPADCEVSCALHDSYTSQVILTKLNTKYNYQSKHNKNYCIMFYNYMFRPFSLGHLQVVYTRP